MKAVMMLAVVMPTVGLLMAVVVPVKAATGPTGCSVELLLMMLMLLVRSRWVRRGSVRLPLRWVLVMMMM